MLGLAMNSSTVAALLVLAPAEPNELLSWQAPHECPSRDHIIREIRQLTLTPDAPIPEPAHADLQKHEDGYQLRLHWYYEGAPYLRVLTARDCRVLAKSVVLSLAVRLPPEDAEIVEAGAFPSAQQFTNVDNATTLEARRIPGRDVVQPTAKTREQRPNPVRQRSRRSRRNSPRPVTKRANSVRPQAPWVFGLAAQAGLGIGLLPGAAIVFAAQLSLRRRLVEFRLTGSFLPTRTKRAGPQSLLGAEFSMWSVGTDFCLRPKHGKFEFPSCLGASLGQIRGEGMGMGVARSLEHRALWSAARAEFAFMWWLHPHVGLGLASQLLIHLRRPVFGLRELVEAPNGGQLFHVPPVGCTFGLRLTFRTRTQPRRAVRAETSPRRNSHADPR